jgi:hypothetical protein
VIHIQTLISKLPRNAALCAGSAVGAGPPAHTTGVTMGGELLPLALVAAALAGAGVWMFRRFGSAPKGAAERDSAPPRETGARTRTPAAAPTPA